MNSKITLSLLAASLSTVIVIGCAISASNPHRLSTVEVKSEFVRSSTHSFGAINNYQGNVAVTVINGRNTPITVDFSDAHVRYVTYDGEEASWSEENNNSLQQKVQELGRLTLSSGETRKFSFQASVDVRAGREIEILIYGYKTLASN